uniref:Prefoldin subunit 4 n=1 Tax=Nothobranchius furzeri TaxID=105023 RepID=A0A8C6VZF8_NOTFU
MLKCYRQVVVSQRLSIERCFLTTAEEVKMAATVMKSPVAVEDVVVTFEDQQKINKFARNTSRMTELKNEIESKKRTLQNLQDASDDLMLLDDDTLLIPYQIGGVFISHSQEETQEMLEAAKRQHGHEGHMVRVPQDRKLWSRRSKALRNACQRFSRCWVI